MNELKQLQKELVDLTHKHSGPELINPTEIPRLYIARCDRPSEPIHALYKPTFCFIVQGEKDVVIADHVLTYSAGQYLVTTIDLPAIGHITKATPANPYLCLVIELDPGVVFEIVKNSEFTESQAAVQKQGFFVDNINLSLTEAMLRLVRTLKNKNDRQILAPLIMQEITYLILNSKKTGHIVKQLGLTGSHTQKISKVLSLIQNDYSQTLKMEDLAKLANMSTSTFHHHFKQVTAMSPLQYQKQIRLMEARRLLTAGLVDAANAGFQVGYESPSQFSREYSRMFGLPPISDIKRLKTTKI